MFIDGIAGITSVTVTCASVIGFPLASVSVATKCVLLAAFQIARGVQFDLRRTAAAALELAAARLLRQPRTPSIRRTVPSCPNSTAPANRS